jgi:hypothetical protein
MKRRELTPLLCGAMTAAWFAMRGNASSPLEDKSADELTRAAR